MSNKVLSNIKDSLGNDLGCRFVPKEDAIDIIASLNDHPDSVRAIWGSGSNDTYELGLGADVTNKSSPVIAAPGGTGNRQTLNVISGYNFSASIDASGIIRAWGAGTSGQLGDLTIVTKSTPVLVCASGGGGFKTHALGRDFVLAVKNDGTLWSWGRAVYGVLGDGAALNKSTPVQVGALTCWKHVWASPSGYQAAGITEDGKLFRWGVNGSGQIGDGTTIVKSSPVQVGAGTDWRTVVNTIALKTNGTLWGWGGNTCGRLGDGTTITRSSPVQIGLGTDWAFGIGAQTVSLAIKTNGTLWSWGRASCHELGDGSTVDRSSPVQVGTASNWKKIVFGRTAIMATKTDGTLWGWGANSSGELGDGTTVAKSTPIQISGGSSDIFNVGQGDLTLFWLREPKLLSNTRDTGFQANTVDIDKLFVRKEHFICSGAMVWGRNNCGQLGDLTTVSKCSPIQICATGPIWKQLSPGLDYVLGIQQDATLWAWGSGASGKLGDGTAIAKSSPVQIGTLEWRQVTTGVSASAAIRCDGTLWAWGANGTGQLGDGTTVAKSSPVQIGTSGDWLCVHYYFCTMLALKTNGTLWSWGCNSKGQIGDGTTVNKSSPVQVGTSTNFIKIAHGADQGIAQKDDFTLWGWGHDYCGTIMSPTPGLCYLTPVQLNSGNNTWRHFNIGGGTFLGIKCDSSLWGIGTNNFGEIGDGTTVVKTTPVMVSSCGWKSVSVTYNHSAGLKIDGTLWTWGRGTNGELGSGVSTSRSSPVQIGSSCNWTKVNVFNYITVGLREEC